MEYMLDVQYFININKESIVKELSLISKDGVSCELYCFETPIEFEKHTSMCLRKQAPCIEIEFTGLEWGESKDTKYRELKDILSGIIKSGNVYVEGRDKREYISDILKDFDVQVINIKDLGSDEMKKFIPKHFVFNYPDIIDIIADNLPKVSNNDEEHIKKYLICQ